MDMAVQEAAAAAAVAAVAAAAAAASVTAMAIYRIYASCIYPSVTVGLCAIIFVSFIDL